MNTEKDLIPSIYFESEMKLLEALDNLMDKNPSLDFFECRLACECNFDSDCDSTSRGYIIAFQNTMLEFWIYCPVCAKNIKTQTCLIDDPVRDMFVGMLLKGGL